MPIPVALAPAIISAGGALASGLINHFSNKSLSNNAFRQNVQMWREQNAYNSPLAQVARMREAGLNPALAYGGSGAVTGNADQAPSLDYGGVMNQPLINPDFAFQAQEALNLKSVRDLQDSQKLKNTAETIESLNRGVLSGAKTKYAEDYAVEELRNMRLNNDKVYQETEATKETIDNIIATRNLTKEQISALMYANKFAERTMEYRIEATQLQNAETRKRMKEIDSIISKNFAEVGLIKQQIQTAVYNNAVLPNLLQNNLRKGIQEIDNLKATGREIEQNIKNLSVKNNIDYMELTNWFWLNAPSMSKIPGAVIGSLIDTSRSIFNN